MKQENTKTICLILHNIRSAHNVGSIFRTADAAGVSLIYLTGYTPAPVDEYERPRKDIAKAALGAEQTIPWLVEKRIGPVLTKLKADGFFIVAIEQAEDALDYKKARPALKTAFIVGNEVTGLPKGALDAADAIAEIPMRGKKESLNVSVAAGIALFRILDL